MTSEILFSRRMFAALTLLNAALVRQTSEIVDHYDEKTVSVPGEYYRFTSTPVTGESESPLAYLSGLRMKISPECWNLGEILNLCTM